MSTSDESSDFESWTEIDFEELERRRKRDIDTEHEKLTEEIETVISSADQPLTRREIEFEVHASYSQVYRALTRLLDEGSIAHSRSENDSRKWVYYTADGDL